MKEIKRWFGWTAVIGPIHMCEQLLFGIDQLDELKGFADSYYSMFSNPNYGTVLLVMLSFTLINLIVYSFLKGGRWPLVAIGLFAFISVGEVHHILKTIINGSYDIGATTAVPFFLFGVMLSRALWREYRRSSEVQSFSAGMQQA